MQINTVYLDMDGVITDFVSGFEQLAIRKGYKKNSEIYKNWSIEGDWGITKSQFWHAIHGEGSTFWANLPKYPYSDSLVNIIKASGKELFILSTPSHKPSSWAGKVEWIRLHYPQLISKTILTEHKYLLAKPGTLLIDDKPENCKKFRENGGSSYMWSQPWNTEEDSPFLDNHEQIKLVQSFLK